MTTLTIDRAVVAMYRNVPAAREAIDVLTRAGISARDISVLGDKQELRDAVLGNYSPPAPVNQGVRHRALGVGPLLGGIIGLLSGFLAYQMTGLGSLAILGPLIGLCAGVVIGGLLGSIFAGLFTNDQGAEFREHLIEGDLLVVIHCSSEEEPHLHQVLAPTHPVQVQTHPYHAVA